MSGSMTRGSRRMALAAVLGLMATGIGGSAAAAAPDTPVVDGWPVIGGFESASFIRGIDAQGNIYVGGRTGFTSLGPGGEVRWTVDYRRFSGFPFLSGDRVYAWDGVSLDAFGTDGSLKWRRRFEDTRKAVAPGPAGGALVYSFGFEGPVVVDSIGPDEVRRWSAPLTARRLETAPVTAPDGTVFVIAENEGLIALDGATGRVRWRAGLEGDDFLPPAVGPDGGVVVAGNGYSATPGTGSAVVQALASDGSARWSSPVSGHVVGPVAVDTAGATFVVTARGSLLAIGPDGARRWETSIARRQVSGPVVGTDGRVSIPSISGAIDIPPRSLVTVDPGTGAIVATTRPLALGRRPSVLAAPGGRLFVQGWGPISQLDPAAQRTRVARYGARLTDATARFKVRPRRCTDRSSRQVCVFSGAFGATLELRAPRAGKAGVQIRRLGDGRLLAKQRAVEVPAGISRLRLGSPRCLDARSTSCTAPGRYRVSVRFTGGHPPVTVPAGVLRVVPSAGRALFSSVLRRGRARIDVAPGSSSAP